MIPSLAIARTLLAACMASTLPGSALSLHEAQVILFQDNPDLAILKMEVERAEAQIDEAGAAWLPSLDALGNYAYTTETGHLKLDLPFPPPGGTSIDRPIGDNDRMEAGVDATYALFTGFSRGRNLEAKRAGARSREAQWRGARNQMSLRLAALFYTWQLSGSQARYQEKILAHASELRKQVTDFVRAGTAVRSRALVAEAREKASEVELLALRNTRDSLAIEFFDFLGGRAPVSGDSPDDLAIDTARLPEPAWGVASGSSAGRPEAEALDQAMAQAHMGDRALLGQRLPQIYGMVGFRYANPGLDLAGDEFMPYGLLGMQLKWNLFDGSKNRAQRRQFDVQARIFREQKRKLEREWSKAMATSRLQHARWTAQFNAATASRDAAQAAAMDLKKQFEAGMATGVEWLDARNNQATAELMMEQARTMQRTALLQWEYASGKELRF